MKRSSNNNNTNSCIRSYSLYLAIGILWTGCSTLATSAAVNEVIFALIINLFPAKYDNICFAPAHRCFVY